MESEKSRCTQCGRNELPKNKCTPCDVKQPTKKKTCTQWESIQLAENRCTQCDWKEPAGNKCVHWERKKSDVLRRKERN
jgi:hypothetical protein